MDVFNVLSLIGGLCLFLFGMNVMGDALEKRAGNGLKLLLAKLTTNRLAGFLTGLAVTGVIQSSSAVTVMVVGFVNSGLMSLRQAMNVIMGANVGTTVTAWILSLSGIESGNLFVRLLKPSSFTPVLALIGIALYMFGKSSKKKDTGMILLGFATLMFGMETMSAAVSGLSEVEGFRNILLLFSNPILGVLAGAVLTGVIQSSSASVGILQALASTGQVTFGAAVPIIMGQNIGTCVTALISSVGTNRNARRAAVFHLIFNITGTAVWLCVFCAANAIFKFAFVNDSANELGIAIVHTVFNLLCTALLMPLTGVLEKLVCRIIPAAKSGDKSAELDERFLSAPSVALGQSKSLTIKMAETSAAALNGAIRSLTDYTPALAAEIRSGEEAADHYEDVIGTYLVKLSARAMTDSDSAETSKLLHVIGDFERISDHAVNILESVEELREKGLTLSDEAKRDLSVISAAVADILELSLLSFTGDDPQLAARVEPLEQVVDYLKEQLRSRHIARLQCGNCSVEAGFVWSDLLTDLERASDHCSNIAGCVIEVSHSSMDLHEYLGRVKSNSSEYAGYFREYTTKYALPPQGGETP